MSFSRCPTLKTPHFMVCKRSDFPSLSSNTQNLGRDGLERAVSNRKHSLCLVIEALRNTGFFVTGQYRWFTCFVRKWDMHHFRAASPLFCRNSVILSSIISLKFTLQAISRNNFSPRFEKIYSIAFTKSPDPFPEQFFSSLDCICIEFGIICSFYQSFRLHKGLVQNC